MINLHADDWKVMQLLSPTEVDTMEGGPKRGRHLPKGTEP